MSVFTSHELAYLSSQRLARIATASGSGVPDVSAVTFGLDGDDVLTGGYDITKTVRYGNLLANPRAVIVIDDLASTNPWTPRGVKVRGNATIEEGSGGLRIRIVATTIWSWGINPEPGGHFRGIERRTVGSDSSTSQ